MNKLRQITQIAAAASPELGNYQHNPRNRADGGNVGYPAKLLGRMEKALARAQEALAQETKSLIQVHDAVMANAQEIAKAK